MGHASVVYVYRDGVECAERSRSMWNEVSAALGEATLQICLGHAGPRDGRTGTVVDAFRTAQLLPASGDSYSKLPTSLRERYVAPRIMSASVANHVNCVNWCDEVHHTDARLYLWSGNCLRPLHQLSLQDLEVVSRLVAEERGQRRAAT